MAPADRFASFHIRLPGYKSSKNVVGTKLECGVQSVTCLNAVSPPFAQRFSRDKAHRLGPNRDSVAGSRYRGAASVDEFDTVRFRATSSATGHASAVLRAFARRIPLSVRKFTAADWNQECWTADDPHHRRLGWDLFCKTSPTPGGN